MKLYNLPFHLTANTRNEGKTRQEEKMRIPEDPCDLCSFEICGMCEWTDQEREEYDGREPEELVEE